MSNRAAEDRAIRAMMADDARRGRELERILVKAGLTPHYSLKSPFYTVKAGWGTGLRFYYGTKEVSIQKECAHGNFMAVVAFKADAAPEEVKRKIEEALKAPPRCTWLCEEPEADEEADDDDA